MIRWNWKYSGAVERVAGAVEKREAGQTHRKAGKVIAIHNISIPGLELPRRVAPNAVG